MDWPSGLGGVGMSRLSKRLEALEAHSKTADQEIHSETPEETARWIQEILSGPDPLAWIETATREQCAARLGEIVTERAAALHETRILGDATWWGAERDVIQRRLNALSN